MHRRLFTIPASLSLILCVGAGVAHLYTMTPPWYCNLGQVDHYKLISVQLFLPHPPHPPE